MGETKVCGREVQSEQPQDGELSFSLNPLVLKQIKELRESNILQSRGLNTGVDRYLTLANEQLSLYGFRELDIVEFIAYIDKALVDENTRYRPE